LHGRCAKRGFTLPELLISIAIIGIITSITLVKYSAFDSTVLAKSAAYEVALTLREAQVNSVSVKRGEINGDENIFSYPYGVHFEEKSSTYTAYVFRSSNSIDYPSYGNSSSEDVGTFTMDRGMKIIDICINGDTSPCDDDDGIVSLDVAFRRPEFNAIFTAIKETDGAELQNSNGVNSAQILVASPNGTHTFVVEVTTLGQMSVFKE
jgi:prepilin-type N-terminal cleavage/methylation domain-containing protein